MGPWYVWYVVQRQVYIASAKGLFQSFEGHNGCRSSVKMNLNLKIYNLIELYWLTESEMHLIEGRLLLEIDTRHNKVKKNANIRNRFNQVSHLTQDTILESDKTLHTREPRVH